MKKASDIVYRDLLMSPLKAHVNAAVGLMSHYVALVLEYCRLNGGPQFVSICNDVGTFKSPIKAQE